MCRWDRAKVNQPYGRDALYACRMRYPINDCQACIRHMRTVASVGDSTTDPFTWEPLIGFSDVGPVYALIRDAGVGAYGGFVVNVDEDPCEGGPLSWGRGDGQAYRDVSLANHGRAGDVCDDSRVGFAEGLVSDLRRLVDGVIFQDGFEAGNTSEWSSSVP